MKLRNCIYVVLLLVVTVFISCRSSENTDPDYYLSDKEQADFKYAISRYIQKLPNRATNENKFEQQFDAYYTAKAEQSSLDKYYLAAGDTVYFEISKIAPSLHLKKTATAGKLLKDSSGNIIYYEEIYRTWKMEEDELAKKTALLFDLLIKGEDLSPYYNENSGDEEYIEFPDKNNRFDVEKRVWIQ